METVLLWMGLILSLAALVGLLRKDWHRFTKPGRSARAEVIGYRSHEEDGTKSYAPIWRFSAEQQVHDVCDAVFTSARQPPLGTIQTLHFPAGRPDLARMKRPWMWSAVYAALIAMAAILAARLMGVLAP